MRKVNGKAGEGGSQAPRAPGEHRADATALQRRTRHIAARMQTGSSSERTLAEGEPCRRLRVSLEHETAQRRRAEKQLRQQALSSALHAEVSAALVSCDPLRRVLQRCCEALVKHLNTAFVRIWTMDARGEWLELQASAGLYTHINGAHARIPVGKVKVGRIAAEGTPHLTNDAIHDPRVADHEWARREGIVAFAGYPLKVDHRVVGVIATFARQRLPEQTISLLAEVADGVAQLIERKRAEDALRAAHVELERRVEERTAELSRANRALEAEIAERVRAEAAAGQSAAALLSFYDSAPLSMGVCELDDADARFVSANAMTAQFLGIPREAFQARLAGELGIPRVACELWFQKFQESERTLGPVHFEYPHPTPVGPRWLSVTVSPIPLGASGRRQFSYVAEDVTERRGAAEMVSQLNARLERRLDRIDALRRIDMAITASLDLRLNLSVVLDQVASQLQVDAADVLVANPFQPVLECMAIKGFHTRSAGQVRLTPDRGPVAQVVRDRRPVHINDLSQQPVQFVRSELLAQERFAAYYAVPLVAKGQVKGVLELFHRSPLAPDGEWIDFMDTLAGQAAIAIDNAFLFENLQRSNVDLVMAYDATIEGWSRALDLRDRETEGHSKRVTDWTLRLAQLMGVSQAEMVHMRRGALLHDIGKMGIPDAILLKPGPLTQEERTVMERHPALAFEMLSPIEFLHPALDIPYCHHEKWDGTGYPRGLRGEQIPLAARIFAAVDVWDALRSDRPYRKAWPEDEVRAHLHSLAGTHLDPAVVRVFLQVLQGAPDTVQSPMAMAVRPERGARAPRLDQKVG